MYARTSQFIALIFSVGIGLSLCACTHTNSRSTVSGAAVDKAASAVSAPVVAPKPAPVMSPKPASQPAAAVAPAAKPAAEQKNLADSVLNPLRFRGDIRRAYSLAKTHADTFSKLFCYCGCDKEMKHKRLISCYVTDHSVWCGTCREEAFAAARLADNGESLGAIQKEIDRIYSNRYPYFRSSTAAYKSYTASRAYPHM